MPNKMEIKHYHKRTKHGHLFSVPMRTEHIPQFILSGVRQGPHGRGYLRYGLAQDLLVLGLGDRLLMEVGF